MKMLDLGPAGEVIPNRGTLGRESGFDRTLAALENQGRQVKHDRPNRAMAQCPAHDDRNPSLSITSTESQALVYCHAGCDTADVLAAVGLELRDLFNDPQTGPYGLGESVGYFYPDGRSNWRSVSSKTFRRDDRAATTPDDAKALYRVDQLADAATVYVCEGEKDADALAAVGGAVVACAGANGARGYDWTPLHGRTVVVVADRDEAGAKYAQTVGELLAGRAQVSVAMAAIGKDAADHVAAGYGLEDLVSAESHLFDRKVEQRAERLRIDMAAKAKIAAENQPPSTPIDMATLGAILARPAPPRDRIDGLAPWEASTLITAQAKTGKTTLIGNLARCLLTGEAFLGRFAVKPLQGNLAILNYEVSAAMLARWLDEMGADHDRVIQVNLRGRSNPLSHPGDRAELAEALRAASVETVIVDPFSRAYTGEDESTAGQVNTFLGDLDTFTRSEVGALDLFLTNHAGWNGERSRGSTALEDWPDALWRIVKPDKDEPARYFSAFGRDVEIPEDELAFDPRTRRLSLTGHGSRRQAAEAARDDRTEADILRVLAAHPEGLSGNQLAEALGKRAGLVTVRNDLVSSGRLEAVKREGRGGGMAYRLTHPEPTEPTENVPNRQVPNLPNLPSIEGGSSSVGMLSQPTETTDPRTCADCGKLIASGRVRCPNCAKTMGRQP